MDLPTPPVASGPGDVSSTPEDTKAPLLLTPDQVESLGAVNVGDTVTLTISNSDETGVTADVESIVPADAGAPGDDAAPPVKDDDSAPPAPVASDEDAAEEKMLGYKRPAKKPAPAFGASAAGLDK